MAKMSELDADRQRIERLTDVGHPPSFADSARAGAPPHTPTPKLVMGYIEVVGPDGEEGIPYDEAVIHIEGDEDSEIEVHCPGALRLAPLIVEAVNNHDVLVKALERIAQSGNAVHSDLPRHPPIPRDEICAIAREALSRITKALGAT